MNLRRSILYSPIAIVFLALAGCGSNGAELGKPIQLNEGISLTYHIFNDDVPGDEGDIIEFELLQKHGDQILVNTFDIPDYRVRAKLTEPLFETDYMQVLRKLSPGDSVEVNIAISTIPSEQLPPQLMETDGDLTFIISVKNLWNEEEVLQTMVDNLSNGNPDAWTITSRGVRIFWDERGTGPKAEFGDSVTIHVRGKFLNGIAFMSTFEKKPLTFLLGEGLLEPRAWEDACSLVTEGDKITVLSPYEMAFGAQDRKPVLKYSTLVFEIDVITIKKA